MIVIVYSIVKTKTMCDVDSGDTGRQAIRTTVQGFPLRYLQTPETLSAPTICKGRFGELRLRSDRGSSARTGQNV